MSTKFNPHTECPDYYESAVPGGSDTQVQFNDGGAFGGAGALTYNKATGALRLDSRFLIARAAVTDNALTTWATDLGGGVASFALLADGGMEWGDGSAARDVTLDRTGASILTLGGKLVASNLTSSALTSGRVVFAGASGLLSDASNFLWDNSNNRLGVNRSSPRKTLSVNGKVNLGSDAEDAALDPYTLAMKDNGAGVFIWRTNNTAGKEPYFLFWAQTSGAYGGQLRALRNGTNAQGFLMSDRTNSKEFMRLQDGKVIINNNGQVSSARHRFIAD